MLPSSTVERALAVSASLLLLCSAPADAAAPIVTIAEGKNVIVSGSAALLPTAGVRLNPCDIVHTGPQGLVQIESADGGKIVLGPDTRFVFDVPQAGDSVVGPHFLIAGWAKVTVPKREKAPAYRIDTPYFDVLLDAGVAVLRAAAEEGEFFVEQGAAIALVPAGSATSRVAVATGRTYSRRSGPDKGAVADRVKPTFVKGMPGAFRDSLPSLLAQLKASDVQARRATDYNAADAEGWLAAVPQLRGCVGNDTVRNAQQALGGRGFSPGPIDGIVGPRTQSALRAYQQSRGAAPTGQLDAETLRSLNVVDRR